MNERGLYMNCVTTMEALAFMDQEASIPAIPRRVWSLPEWDITIAITTTHVSYAVLALGGLTISAPQGGFWPGGKNPT